MFTEDVPQFRTCSYQFRITCIYTSSLTSKFLFGMTFPGSYATECTTQATVSDVLGCKLLGLNHKMLVYDINRVLPCQWHPRCSASLVTILDLPPLVSFWCRQLLSCQAVVRLEVARSFCLYEFTQPNYTSRRAALASHARPHPALKSWVWPGVRG